MKKSSLLYSLSCSSICSIKTLQEWSRKYDTYIPQLIKTTRCKKWYKWYYNKEVPYPCVCNVRDSYCIELELYYELQQVLILYSSRNYFKKATEEYNSIEKTIWLKKYRKVGEKLFFSPVITIFCNSEKNDKLTIKLNPNEFNTVIQFQEVFNTVYYSEKFQTNINP